MRGMQKAECGGDAHRWAAQDRTHMDPWFTCLSVPTPAFTRPFTCTWGQGEGVPIPMVRTDPRLPWHPCTQTEGGGAAVPLGYKGRGLPIPAPVRGTCALSRNCGPSGRACAQQGVRATAPVRTPIPGEVLRVDGTSGST
jgi:hypothetical protein